MPSFSNEILHFFVCINYIMGPDITALSFLLKTQCLHRTEHIPNCNSCCMLFVMSAVNYFIYIPEKTGGELVPAKCNC